MKRGVGFPPPPFAQWEDPEFRHPIDPAVRPWGEGGGAYALAGDDDDQTIPDPVLWRQRYGARAVGNPPGGAVPIGTWSESEPLNYSALLHWYARQSIEHQRQWTGRPTAEEVHDAMVSTHRRAGSDGGFYAAVFASQQGGRPETATVIDAQNLSQHAWRFEPGGGLEQRLGLQSSPNPLGYRFYFDVQVLPGVVEDPVDPVDPVDPEEPPIEPAPTLSPIDQRIRELRVLLRRRVDRAKIGWARRFLADKDRPEGEVDIVDLGLYWLVYAKRAFVAIVRKLLGEDWRP